MKKRVSAIVIVGCLSACGTPAVAPPLAPVAAPAPTAAAPVPPAPVVVDRNLNDADLTEINRTTQTALETGTTDQALVWSNPDSGHSGSVTPGPYYETADGRYCRRFSATTVLAGESRQQDGTACRAPDGTWQVAR